MVREDVQTGCDCKGGAPLVAYMPAGSQRFLLPCHYKARRPTPMSVTHRWTSQPVELTQIDSCHVNDLVSGTSL